MRCLDNLEADLTRLPRMPGSSMVFKVGGTMVAKVVAVVSENDAPLYVVDSDFSGLPQAFGLEHNGIRPTSEFVLAKVRVKLATILEHACSGIHRDGTRSFVEGAVAPAV